MRNLHQFFSYEISSGNWFLILHRAAPQDLFSSSLQVNDHCV